jgi:hypothetical protein
MKIIIKVSIYALVLILLNCFEAAADDKETKKPTGFNTGIYCSITGKINVYVDRASKSKPAVIFLTNASGKIFYHEMVPCSYLKFGRALNVDQLEPGVYSLNVVINGEAVRKSFVLSEKKTERILAIR